MHERHMMSEPYTVYEWYTMFGVVYDFDEESDLNVEPNNAVKLVLR
jgi:hypothetical protein